MVTDRIVTTADVSTPKTDQSPDLEAVNRALSVTVQKQQTEITLLRKALLEAAQHLRLAGWHGASEKAKDAAS